MHLERSRLLRNTDWGTRTCCIFKAENEVSSFALPLLGLGIGDRRGTVSIPCRCCVPPHPPHQSPAALATESENCPGLGITGPRRPPVLPSTSSRQQPAGASRCWR